MCIVLISIRLSLNLIIYIFDKKIKFIKISDYKFYY